MLKNLYILVVSRPGSWRRMIINQLSNYVSLVEMSVASGGLTAAERITKNYPDLLLIDSSIELEDVKALVSRARSLNAGTTIIAIADTHHERNQIKNFGADFVISSFLFESELRQVFENLEQNCLL